MLPLVDTPIIQFVVEEAIASGIEDILIITGRGKRAIEDHFDRSVELETFLTRNRKEGLLSSVKDLGNMADIHFVRQKEQLGLGHAILQARQHVGDEPFAVLLGDEIFVGAPPCLGQLMDVHEGLGGGSVVGVQEVVWEDVSRYGVIRPQQIRDRFYRALDLVEKPARHEAPSNLAIIGRYVLDPAIFEVLAETQPGRNGEIQLTDGLRQLNGSAPVYAYYPDTRRYDVGEKLGYLKATIELALERSELTEEFGDYLEELVGGRKRAQLRLARG
jgi:UTP--glucose-1-phosphate uridylyltransferase